MAKIVVIDDDRDILLILQHALQLGGHTVIVAQGGEEGIRRVKATRPDLVITDLRMPGVGGIDVIAEVKDDPETGHIPVIAVTGHVWDQLAQTASSIGCDGFISKPFERQTLLAQIGKYLDPRRRRPLPGKPVT